MQVYYFLNAPLSIKAVQIKQTFLLNHVVFRVEYIFNEAMADVVKYNECTLPLIRGLLLSIVQH